MGTSIEALLGGFASSALARRRGLNWEQGFGVYLTNRRLIIIRVKTSFSLKWNVDAGAMVGSIGARVTPFLDQSPQSMESLEQTKSAFEAPLHRIVSIELEKPHRVWGKGHVRIRLSSGKTYDLGLVEESDNYSDETFDELVKLFREQLPTKLEIL